MKTKVKKHSNKCNKNIKCDCDGYHTFSELYEHRIALFIALCHCISHLSWRSKAHSDGTKLPGWFVLGINEKWGKQVTYHIPDKYWEKTKFAFTLRKAPAFDGHTSDDVLERLESVGLWNQGQ